jgi:hypothetical protein
MWHGWTTVANADAYATYLREELFPRVRSELSQHGYRGFNVLRLARGDEVEFVTQLWFESIDAVRSFAGENYETPVISAKAQSLLARYAKHCDHFNLSSFDWPASANGPAAG